MTNCFERNIDNDECLNTIRQKIKDVVPFCLARFGDGEAMILNDVGSEPFWKRVCAGWGFTYPNELDLIKKELKKVLAYALTSDIIGVLYAETCPSRVVYNNSKINKSDDKVVCDHQITRSVEFGNPINFTKNLEIDNIHIITTRKKN